MRRDRCPPRAGWQEKVEALGLSFHSADGQPYWCEDACYTFSTGEIDALEDATNALHELCLTAAERLILGGDLGRLAIPEGFWPWIAESWRRGDPSLYGRFDLAYDGAGPPKMLEYNADTPTALVEAAVVQWYWLEEARPRADQFNSIHERLIAAWASLPPGEIVHFAGVLDEDEDRITIDYLRDVCQQAGLETVPLDIAEVGWNGCDFTDLHERPIGRLFKLYPWEWLLAEEFARHLPESRTRFIEPPWKMVLSTKAILPILWEMFPGHPNLLPASFERSSFSGACVEKPFHGREGQGIRILGAQDPGRGDSGGDGPKVWQAHCPLPEFDGRQAVIGAWVVAGEAAGLGIRDSAGPITGNDCLFVPHCFGVRPPVAMSPVAVSPVPQVKAAAKPKAKAGFPRNAPVVATPVLLFLILAVFLAELWRFPRLEAADLAALGGLNRVLVLDQGQWYRLVAAVFLHGSVVHLACNAAVLGFAGWNLERIVGSRWLLAVYAAGGLAGAIASLALNPASVVSVGASGAIMGLLAALLVLTFRERLGTTRLQRQMFLLRLLIPAVIPAAAGPHVDVSAHLGGALGGALMGVAISLQWATAL